MNILVSNGVRTGVFSRGNGVGSSKRVIDGKDSRSFETSDSKEVKRVKNGKRRFRKSENSGTQRVGKCLWIESTLFLRSQ